MIDGMDMKNLRMICPFHTYRKWLFCLLFFPSLLTASFPYFIPPKSWQCVPPSDTPSEYIQIRFVGPPSSNFFPSINLAIEETDLSLKQYVQAVKAVHKEDLNNRSCKSLGKIKLNAGEGHLLEIISEAPKGTLKKLQAIYMKEGYAYILTGSFHSNDSSDVQQQLLSCLQSFNIIPNLWTPLDRDSQQMLKTTFDSFSALEEEKRGPAWTKLQKTVSEHSELGAHWQFLVLKEGYQRIYR